MSRRPAGPITAVHGLRPSYGTRQAHGGQFEIIFGRDRVEPAVFGRAVEFIDAYAHSPISVGDIAAARISRGGRPPLGGVDTRR
jgi:hypothetical protein